MASAGLSTEGRTASAVPHSTGDRGPWAGAVRHAAPALVGLFPIGLAFGVLIVQSGLAWWWAPVFSFLIYAGSMEFLAIGLVLAATPLLSLALTTVLVNGRHVFYGLGFPLARVPGRLRRAYAVYALTDEAYALLSGSAGDGLSGRQVIAVQLLCQAAWVAGGVLGAAAGSLVPAGLQGLEFALTALFVVLALDAFRATGELPAPVLGLLAGLMALLVAPGQMLLVALGIFVALLVGRYVYGRRAGVVVT